MQFPYMLVDLTHTLDPTIPSWDGDCGFTLEGEWSASSDAGGPSFHLQQMKMHAGIGTHMDAPAHCIPGGLSIADLPLDQLIAPCVVLDQSDNCHADLRLLPQDIEIFESIHGPIASGSFVFVYTGWAQFWSDADLYRNNHVFPSIARAAAEMLLERGVCGLGIDTLSPDRPAEGFPVHQLFLGQGKYLIENAASLEKMPPCGGFVLALPIKIKEAAEAPVRLVGIIPRANEA